MRLFFALPLPEAVKDGLAGFQARLREAGIRASWPDPRGLHLTLAFLGEVEASKVPLLMGIAERCAACHPCFSLRTSHCGGFPLDRAARVLWLGLEAQPELVKLCAALRAALVEADVPFDGKPFRPHLTLARLKPPADISNCTEPGPFSFEVQSLVLYRSESTPAGARYRDVGIAYLGGRP